VRTQSITTGVFTVMPSPELMIKLQASNRQQIRMQQNRMTLGRPLCNRTLELGICLMLGACDLVLQLVG
jgi:hypothetical protein